MMLYNISSSMNRLWHCYYHTAHHATPSLVTLKNEVKSKSVNKPGHVSSVVSMSGYILAGSRGMDDAEG